MSLVAVMCLQLSGSGLTHKRKDTIHTDGGSTEKFPIRDESFSLHPYPPRALDKDENPRSRRGRRDQRGVEEIPLKVSGYVKLWAANVLPTETSQSDR